MIMEIDTFSKLLSVTICDSKFFNHFLICKPIFNQLEFFFPKELNEIGLWEFKYIIIYKMESLYYLTKI